MRVSTMFFIAWCAGLSLWVIYNKSYMEETNKIMHEHRNNSVNHCCGWRGLLDDTVDEVIIMQ